MSKVYTVSELQNILSPIFQQNGVKQAILFGSYAKGFATPESDIDLLVDSGLRGLAFFGLLEDVATAIDAPVDLLDVSQIKKTPGSTGRSERAGLQFMDSKDRRVLQKLQAHTEAILRYCQDCCCQQPGSGFGSIRLTHNLTRYRKYPCGDNGQYSTPEL